MANGGPLSFWTDDREWAVENAWQERVHEYRLVVKKRSTATKRTKKDQERRK